MSAGERYASVYEINLSRCIFCGYCEIACPFDAITMGHDYEMSDYTRSDLIFTKEMLLAEPIERTPLRNGRRMSVVLLLPRVDHRDRGRVRGRAAAQPVLQRARARLPPGRAVGAVPAAARRVRRRRAGDRLRRRGDGALRVRRRLRRRRRGATPPGQLLRVLGPLFAVAIAIELCHRDARLGALPGSRARARRTSSASAPPARSGGCS